MAESKVDKQVLSLLDIIGSAIVDNFYNHLYDKAIALKEKTNKSITECYRGVVITYVKDNDSQQFFKKLIESIQFYTKITLMYDNISYIECISLYSKLFIPDQYFLSMTENQKNNILFMVLKSSIDIFTQNILSSYINLIIDEHNSDNALFLQNLFLEILLAQRSQSYDKFIKTEQTVYKAKGVKINTKKNKFKDQVMLKITNKYKKCIDDYKEMKHKYTDIKHKYNTLNQKSKEMQDMCLAQLNQAKLANLEINKLKKIINDLEHRYASKKNVSFDLEETKDNSNYPNNRQSYQNDFTFDDVMSGPTYLEGDDD